MRFTRIRLFTLLALVSIFAVTFGWFITNSEAARKEKAVIAQLDLGKRGGVIIYDYQTRPMCNFGLTGFATRTQTSVLGRLGGSVWPSTFYRITKLEIADSAYNDDTLEIVAQLPHLRELIIYENSMTPSGIKQFRSSYPHVIVKVATVGSHNPTSNDDPYSSSDSSHDPFRRGDPSDDPFLGVPSKDPNRAPDSSQ